MTFSGFDPELLGQLDRSGASSSKIYFLQRIIRSIEPDTLLSQHSAALAGMATELPRAQAALLSYGERLQPTVTLLGALCRNASASVARSAQFRPDNQLLADLTSALATVEVDIIGVNDPHRRKTTADALAARLDKLIDKVPALLTSMFIEAWSMSCSTVNDWNYLKHVSDEFACMVASSDRDRSTLDQQLTYTVARHGLEPELIIQTLLPAPAKYKVACVVYGAGKFSSLANLEPSAQQSSPRFGGNIQWGPATNRLREFLARAPDTREACVVSVDVEAVDKPSAGRLGRRRITELLDQYVAGHRLIRLELGDDTLVTRAGAQNDTEGWQPRNRAVVRAYPLLDHWPEGLREGLRMAHIARATDSPLTAAALSWVALEACGVQHRQQRRLARALSLQALRQQVLEAHHNVLQSVVASTQYARTQAENAAALAEKYRRGLARCPVHLPAYGRLEALMETATQRSTAATNRKNELENLFRDPLSTIRAYAVADERNHLADLNTWVDVLLPPRSSDTNQLVAARTALDTIVPYLSPLTARQILDWQWRLRFPGECAEWLSTMQARIESLLDALYGARNLALHSGIFAATGDAILGQGAVMLVDFTLEFLGNWYRNTTQPDAQQTPAAVIEQLANRQVQLVRCLRSHSGPAYALNVAWLSSPTSTDGWDRL